MEKLKFDVSNMPEAEVLTKEQLKTIQGGVLSGGGSSCTESCAGGLTTCTSDSMNCSHTKNDAGYIVSISCDSHSYDC